MHFADLLPDILKPIAKAVAVFVTGLIVVGLDWLIAAAGVDIPYDAVSIELAVAAILLTFVTWATTNRPSTSGDGSTDRGSISLMDVLVVLAIVAVIIWIVITVT